MNNLLPKNVIFAAKLINAVLVVSLVRALLDGINLDFFIQIIVVGFLFFLLRKIQERNNWARVTLSIFFVIFSFFGILILISNWQNLGSGLYFILFELLFYVLSVILLFQRDSSQWFKSKVDLETA